MSKKNNNRIVCSKKKYLDFFQFQQNAIDLSDRYSNTTEFEFPALYKQSKEEFDKENTRHKVDFIMSTQGRNLVLNDLSNKKYSLRRLLNTGTYQEIASHYRSFMFT